LQALVCVRLPLQFVDGPQFSQSPFVQFDHCPSVFLQFAI
jgi:hypothetical protein